MPIAHSSCDRFLSEEECRLQITRESAETQVTKTYCTYCEGRAIRTPKGSSNSFVSKQRRNKLSHRHKTFF